MKDRLIIWLSNMLFSYLSQEAKASYRDVRLRNALKDVYLNSEDHFKLDRDVKSIIFDIKYTERLRAIPGQEEAVPSKVLLSFYSLANKGDSSFIKNEFYRVLSKSKDIEIRRLWHRLNIKQ